jgi:hypothetical protein
VKCVFIKVTINSMTLVSAPEDLGLGWIDTSVECGMISRTCHNAFLKQEDQNNRGFLDFRENFASAMH